MNASLAMSSLDLAELDPHEIYARRRQEAALSLAGKAPAARTSLPDDDLQGLALTVYDRRRAEAAGKLPPQEFHLAPMQTSAPATTPPAPAAPPPQAPNRRAMAMSAGGNGLNVACGGRVRFAGGVA